MGYVQNLPQVKETLQNILFNIPPLDLKVTGITRSSQAFNGYYFSHLEIENAGFLRTLHHDIVTKIPFVITEHLPLAAFVTNEGESIVQSVYDYISVFKTHHSGNAYWPHITLGAGNDTDKLAPVLPKTFQVEKVSLCKLGNYCTCRQILGEWELGTHIN